MSRDKQIKDMAKHCHFYEEGKCLLLEDEAEECDTKCDMCEFAKRLYNAGYRKIYDDNQRQCTCAESDYFLKPIDLFWCECDSGEVEMEGTE